MRIKSFIDVITSYIEYADHTIGTLEHDEEIDDADQCEYVAEFFGSNEKYTASNLDYYKVQDFKNLIFYKFKELSKVILIDRIQDKIYTDITKEDHFFYKLALNVDSDSHKDKKLDVVLLTNKVALIKIINKSFPDPDPEQNSPCLIQ